MKRIVLLTVAATLVFALGGAMAQANAADPQAPFVGAWWSIDPLDDSMQKLCIRPGWWAGKYRLYLFDNEASICQCEHICSAIATGWGSASNSVLGATMRVYCLGRSSRYWGSITMIFEVVDGTLVDSDGVVWHPMGTAPPL